MRPRVGPSRRPFTKRWTTISANLARRRGGAPTVRPTRSSVACGARARRLVALLGAEDPDRIIFTANGTESLNLAIHGVLRPGDHVVTSVVDHNSVLRPLRFLAEQHGIQVEHVPCGADGIIDPQSVRRALRPHTRLIALVHASNVTGALQPVEEVGQNSGRTRRVLPGGRGPVAGPSADRCAPHRGAFVRRTWAQRTIGTLRPGHLVRRPRL